MKSTQPSAHRRDAAARLLREMRDDPRRRIPSEASRRAAERLIDALKTARRAVCPYPGNTCDCKHGAFPGGDPRFQPRHLSDESTGCPELRAMIRELEEELDPVAAAL